MEHLRLWLVKDLPTSCHCLVEWRMDSSIQGEFLRRKTAVCFLIIFYFSFLFFFFSFDDMLAFIFCMLVCDQTKFVKSQGICIVNSALVKPSLPKPMNRLLSERMLQITYNLLSRRKRRHNKDSLIILADVWRFELVNTYLNSTHIYIYIRKKNQASLDFDDRV